MQGSLEGFRPVQCIACLNGRLSAEETEFSAVAYAEGDIVGIPVRQLIALGKDILCLIIARIHDLIEVRRRLQNRFHIRVGVRVGHAAVLCQHAVIVPVHRNGQEAHGVLSVGVHVAVRGDKTVVAAGCAILLYLAVYLRVVIIYAPHIACQQVGLVVVRVLQRNGEDHLLTSRAVSVEVANSDGLNITVGNTGGAACAVVGALEIAAGIYLHRCIVADVIQCAVEEHQLLSAAPLAVDCHGLHSQPLPYVIGIMVAAIRPAVSAYGPVQVHCLGKPVSGVGQLAHIHIV